MAALIALSPTPMSDSDLAPALALIRAAEGLRLETYKDPRPGAPIPTIGYGHTGRDVHPLQIISLEEAEALLLADARGADADLVRLVKVRLTRNQRIALISFVYNVGAKKFATSNVLRLLNAGNYAGAARAMLRWCHAGTKILPGLEKRRKTEVAIFNAPDKEGRAWTMN